MASQQLAFRALAAVACVGVASVSAATKYPTVTAHGMGDSCFNSGMQGQHTSAPFRCCAMVV